MPISTADLQSLQKSMPQTSKSYEMIQNFLNNPALLNSQIGQDQLASVLGTAQQGVNAQQNPTYTYNDPSGLARSGTSVPAGATNIGSSASKLSTNYNPANVSSLQQQLANNPATSFGIPPSGSATTLGGGSRPQPNPADPGVAADQRYGEVKPTISGQPVDFTAPPTQYNPSPGGAGDPLSSGRFTNLPGNWGAGGTGGGGPAAPARSAGSPTSNSGPTLQGGPLTEPGDWGPRPAGPATSNNTGTDPLSPQSSGFRYNPISINNPTIQTQFQGANYPGGQPAGYNIPQGAVPAGANGAFANWSNTPGGNGQGYSGGDPGYMASAEANRAVDIGNNFENQYANEYLQALGQQNQYQGAADSAYNDLAQTPGYTAQEAQGIQGDPYAVQGVVGQTADAMNSAIDPSKLGFSDQYVQQLKDQAAGQIGAQYGANMDSLQREADASGNVNPLALAAARNRYLQSQAIDSANALTGADIQATGAQRQANTNIANMRLGAATTLGGMGLQAGQYADTAASNRNANIAQQRIQGQQAARNYWQSQSQFQGGQANQATQARLAGAQTSLSGMGQGGQLAATTEIGRRSTANRINIGAGPNGVTVGTSVGV